MNIRLARHRDIPGLLALLAQVGQVHHALRPDLFPRGTLKYDAPGLERLLQDPLRPVFVAEEDGVAGYCFCQCRQIPASASSVARRELYIDDLCVEENRQRRGIAAALYRHVEEYARAEGFGHIILNVWQGNAAAMAFYEAMGMKPRSITMETVLEDPKC